MSGWWIVWGYAVLIVGMVVVSTLLTDRAARRRQRHYEQLREERWRRREEEREQEWRRREEEW